MSVRLLDDQTIELAGRCGLDDADLLLQHILAAPAASVDWRACEQAHTAVIQTLLVCDPTLRGPPVSAFLRDIVAPMIAAASRSRVASVRAATPRTTSK